MTVAGLFLRKSNCSQKSIINSTDDEALVTGRATGALRAGGQRYRQGLRTDIGGGLKAIIWHDSGHDNKRQLTAWPLVVILAATNLVPLPVASTLAVNEREPSAPLRKS